jgi:hypothetical protein
VIILRNKFIQFAFSVISLLSLSACSFNLGFEPTRLYKFSAELKYFRDNNVLQEKPEIQLFNSYDQMCNWFDESTYPYGGESQEEAYDDILKNVDFETNNLFAYMRYDGTGSTTRAVCLNENIVTFYSYTPDVVTLDIAYKWFIFEIDKKYSLNDIEIEHKEMSKEQTDYLIENYSFDFYY